MPRLIRIIHLDDEPDTIDWIVDELQLYCINRDPKWKAREISIDTENGHTRHTFAIAANSDDQLEYCICETFEQFKNEFARPKGQPDLVIIDLMQETDDGLHPNGKPAFEHAAAILKTITNIFVLSGFARDARENLPKEFPSDQIIAKPPPIDSFVELLAKRLQL
jgi:hypothetical protein